MSIDEGWGRTNSVRRVAWLRRFGFGSAVLTAIVLAACSGETADTELEDTTPAVVQDQAPAAAPAAEQPATVADIFPEGPGKQLVLSNCASCHAVACTAIGQRPEGRWNELREAHREHVPSLSEEELTATFAYLSENFSANQPEPSVPPQFLQQGCTPF
jgi:cytochrome c5